MLGWILDNWKLILGGLWMGYGIYAVTVSTWNRPMCRYPGCKNPAYFNQMMWRQSTVCRKHYGWAKRRRT
jgi:hypothetical protein